ncbi:OLC1v1007613C1 [Oldenlandia corymbosa var. corymbosa]|uniref:RING-type E3 ubiquitin transferase n=1 Tax=Oldenlandia corymbosa var. corymbosa TaxID=529605 RepID=A0AAV1DJR4_OLDCO|nr:OLC1v1007613C1 [Oldenlandia corymbosa var. corymbosa]
MEVLSPSHPPGGQTDILFSGFSPPHNFLIGAQRRRRMRSPEMITYPSRSAEIVEEEGGNGEKVHVAVGKSVAKVASLLNWCFRTFPGSEICILHVHKPSPLIPTLLGKLPASQANAEVVTAFRNEEWEETRKLMHSYLTLCTASKVKASILTSESDQVQNEIVNLVSRHDIKKLVMGAVPDCSKLKKCSSKASYTAKMAPPFCKIWFVNKGNLVWIKEDLEDSSFAAPLQQEYIPASSNLRSQSAPSCKGSLMFHPECIRSSSDNRSLHRTASLSSSSGCTSSAEPRASSDSIAIFEEDGLSEWLEELKKEAEESRDEALSQLSIRRKSEAEAAKAFRKVKSYESAHALQVKLRKEAEATLKSIVQEQDKLLEEREVLTGDLQKAMRNIAILESRTQEANCRCENVAGELKLIQVSLAALSQEKQKILRQKNEAMQWLDHWKGRAGIIAPKPQFTGDTLDVVEFLVSDLESATCSFSESFKIGEGGYGSVYKGELLNRTVAIKTLRSLSIQNQPEFLHEIEVLGRLRHPHLVQLIGVCPELRSLVYEYLPGGSLQDRLFHKNILRPLDWKTRVRLISEIASALLFLHSLGPEGLAHGDLKPNNIILDSKNTCKICDFGIFRLVLEKSLRCPSFRKYTETKSGAFPYADPEFYRTGIRTPKSDIFSFGLIILQLLTGKAAPAGLACDVRKMVSCGKITSILDSSAGEWSTFVARRLVDLALQCCELNGRDRPCLTPMLVRELEQLHVLEEKPVPSFFLCPILQEIMHDPQVAADGFTYEGEALRGWFENGRETSPMTNLKLMDLTLTPNHSLRLAIQDWLRKS